VPAARLAVGLSVTILFPTDVPAGPSTTLVAGRVVFTVDQDGVFTVQVDGQLLHAYIASDGLRTLVAIDGCVYEFVREEKKIAQSRQREAGRLNPEIRSPMPGKILEVRVSEDETVEAGQVLVVLEAMKMENALTAEGPARVRKLHVSSGELVDLGQLLVELEFPQAAMQTESP